MRYALRYQNGKTVHLTDDDEARNSICGLSCSLDLRYSRRTVVELQGRRNCARCEIVMAARKKRAVR